MASRFHFVALGADPEVFLVDKDGQPFSAEGLFGGTKYKPKPMGIGEGFFIQEDNVSAEYNIPPSTTAAGFARNIEKGLSYIRSRAKKLKLNICLESALKFPEQHLTTKHAQTLGYEPDYNIWSMRVNERPVPPKLLRTAAGHVHASWKDPEPDQVTALVRTLDVILGVPSILVTKKNERRSLYGRAGAFRPKDYGVEYRTLDNFWIGRLDYSKFVFNGVTKAMNRLSDDDDGFFLEDVEEHQPMIEDCINNYDKDLALHLVEHFNLDCFPH